MGKSFTPNAPRPGSASADPGTPGKPALVRSADSVIKARKFNDAPKPKPIRDAFSAALGDTIFAQDAMFDWCCKPSGARHTFRRHYPQIRVLFDSFGGVTDAVRQEIAEKRAAIEAYNKQHRDAEYGYLPTLSTQMPTADEVELAKLGDCVPLREPLKL